MLATCALVASLAVGAVVALAAPGAVTQAAAPSASAARAAYCPAGEKQRRRAEFKTAQAQLNAFRKSMAAARTRYFRTHRGSRDRARFVARQNAQVKAMQALVKRKQRELARCD